MRPQHIVQALVLIGICVFCALHGSAHLSWWWLVGFLLAYISLLVLGAIYIQWNFYLRSYNKGRNDKHIALTFDDGPSETSIAILDVLKEQGIPATFFVIGKNAAAHPDLLKRIDEEGHIIGNHSYDHGFNFDWKMASAMVEELQHTNDVVKQATGKTPNLFRPPYGVTNPNVARAVKRLKMASIGWSVRSYDTTAKDPDQLLKKIIGELKGGDIVLLHDTKAVTVQILKNLIVQAQQKGFTFVRVDTLLDIKAYA
jgi:peptidoglycan-N-acetylglucosamine deacetylase